MRIVDQGVLPDHVRHQRLKIRCQVGHCLLKDRIIDCHRFRADDDHFIGAIGKAFHLLNQVHAALRLRGVDESELRC